MKILNRLNEEGSNADEPLNIKLSDYSRYYSVVARNMNMATMANSREIKL